MTRSTSGTISSLWCVIRMSVVPPRTIAAHLLHEAMPRAQIETSRRLVEHERTRRRRQDAGKHHPPRFPTRHLIHGPLRQVRRSHGVERLGSTEAHRVGDFAIPKYSVRHQKPRQHSGFAGDAALAVAGNETLMEIGRHDAKLRPQLENVPAIAAKNTHRGRRALVNRKSALVVRQEADQHGFAGPVGTKDGGVLPFANRQPQPIEDGAIAFDDGGVVQFENIGQC